MNLLQRAFTVFVMVGFVLVKAQNTDSISLHPQDDLWLLEDNLEQLSIDSESDDNWEDELDDLAHRLREPINLNTATRKQLEQFPFLSDLHIENILAYRYLHGSLRSVYELQAVENMDRRTIEQLFPFVYVSLKQPKEFLPSIRQLCRHGRHEILSRMDIPLYTRTGYKTSYLGPSLYHSLKYSFRYGDFLQCGLTAEKDAGEPMFALHNSQGYDFYSYYLLLHTDRILQTLALGNYRLSFGQGLVLGNVFCLGKSFSLSTSDYRAGGIKKHSSTDEYRYFRGIAVTLRPFAHGELSTFYSHRKLDGVVTQGHITSIYKTGLHRSAKEAAKRDALTMQLAGGNLTYTHQMGQVGLTGIYYFFDRPYQPRIATYSKFDIHGNHFYNLGIDYRLHWRQWTLSGETAKGKQGFALLNKLQYSPSSSYRFMLLHRFYSHDYWAFFAQAWGESSRPQNENGWYVAAEVAPLARWRFFGSLDLFSFPWWRYRISRPSQGWEGRLQASYSLNRVCNMYLNYRYKQKDRDVTGSGGTRINTLQHHRLRYRLMWMPTHWKWQTTFDYNCLVEQKLSQGYQFTQQCSYVFRSLPLSLTAQGSWFQTDNYDSRVYMYEKGLLQTFYTPSFFGKGIRYSVHVRCDFNQHWMLLCKLGQTCYMNRQEIGTGPDLIASNIKTDIQLQMRFKF